MSKLQAIVHCVVVFCLVCFAVALFRIDSRVTSLDQRLNSQASVMPATPARPENTKPSVDPLPPADPPPPSLPLSIPAEKAWPAPAQSKILESIGKSWWFGVCQQPKEARCPFVGCLVWVSLKEGQTPLYLKPGMYKVTLTGDGKGIQIKDGRPADGTPLVYNVFGGDQFLAEEKRLNFIVYGENGTDETYCDASANFSDWMNRKADAKRRGHPNEDVVQ